MNPADFDLQHTDIPQPTLVDEELATRDWPMPPVKPWAPLPDDRPEPGSIVMVEPPRPVSLWTQIKQSKLLGRLR